MKKHTPSMTARLIAASLLLQHKRDPITVKEDVAAWSKKFLSSSRADKFLSWGAQSSAMKPVWAMLEALTFRGFPNHIAARKNTIERYCRQLIENKQVANVIVLGAGLDSLAIRLARHYPDCTFTEIDHPATQACKKQVLADCELPKNITFKAVDLTEQSHQVASPNGGCLTIAEGLFMYLPESDVKKTTHTALTQSSHKNYLLFTYMEQKDDAPAGFRPRSRLIDFWLKKQKEPFVWSIHPDQLADFCQNCGGQIDMHRFAKANDVAVLAKTSLQLEGENLVLLSTNAASVAKEAID